MKILNIIFDKWLSEREPLKPKILQKAFLMLVLIGVLSVIFSVLWNFLLD